MNNQTFDFGNGPVPAHQHPNGGGWVADTATVAITAYVGPDAHVFGDAKVCDDARVFGNAWVSGNAHAWVASNAQVCCDTMIPSDKDTSTVEIGETVELFRYYTKIGDNEWIATNEKPVRIKSEKVVPKKVQL
jgi:hypothetical protein